MQVVLLGMIAPYFYTTFIASPTQDTASSSYLLGFFIATTLCWFCSFFMLPSLLGTSMFNLNFSDIGVKKPVLNKSNVQLICCSAILLMVLGYVITRQPSVRAFYSSSLSHFNLATFIFVNLVLLPINYFAEEFFFRGILFLTLWRLVGWHSYWIADILFTWGHQFKPIPEIYLSAFAGMILNYMTYKTESIYPAIISHGSLGILINVLVYFNV